MSNLQVPQARIEEVLVAEGIDVPTVMLAPWPVATVDARTHATPAGDLVLVNTGGPRLAEAMARICVILFDGFPEDAALRVLEVVGALLRNELIDDVTNAIPFTQERVGGIRLLSSFGAWSVVCHEDGHVVLGHTTDGASRALLDIRRQWPSEGAVLWSQRQELEADQFALSLLLRLAPESDSDIVRLGNQRYAVLGPLLMFTLQGLMLEAPWSRGDFGVGDGHPPPIVRVAGVMEAAKASDLGDAVDAGQGYLDWYERFALPAVRRALQGGRFDA